MDREAETDEEGSDEDRKQAAENGMEARISKALVGKATRAKERLSKRVPPCHSCLLVHLQQKRHMPRWGSPAELLIHRLRDLQQATMARISKALVGKATRAKEQLSKRVRHVLDCVMI